MKLKLGQLNQISNILQVITSESKAQVKVMYDIIQKVLVINELLKPLDETRTKLMSKYDINEYTNTTSPEYNSFMNDLQEVLNIEIECDIKIDFSSIENFEITGSDMFALHPILNVTENNDNDNDKSNI